MPQNPNQPVPPQPGQEALSSDQIVAANERLMGVIINSPSMTERVQAARTLGLMSPEEEQPPQVRIVLRLVRRPEDGVFWPQLEGSKGAIVQYLFREPAACIQVLSAVAALAVHPFLTQEEFQAQQVELEQMAAKVGDPPDAPQGGGAA